MPVDQRIRRSKTRRERYSAKMENALSLPASLVTVNFHCDGNLATLIRVAACFGFDTIHVIGSIPDRKLLANPSGSTLHLVKLKQYSNPSHFLEYARNRNFKLISAELTQNSHNLYNYEFDFNNHTAIILGNETTGVPTELLNNSEIIHIPMPGSGFCLNTSQTGTIFISEYVRQFLSR